MNFINLAIVGSQGLIPHSLFEYFNNNSCPIDNCYILDSSSLVGDDINLMNQNILVEDVNNFNFSKVDIVIFISSKDISKKYAQIAVSSGCWVIDNSSFFSNNQDIPMIIPEINSSSIFELPKNSIISQPSCSSTAICLSLNPVFENIDIDSIDICTLQSTSGVGTKGINELIQQTSNLLSSKSINNNVFEKQIGFNVIPCIGNIEKNGFSNEENNIIRDLNRTCGFNSSKINVTALRIPIFYSHSACINIRCKYDFNVNELINIYQKLDYIQIYNDKDYPTGVDAIGNSKVHIGRIRQNFDDTKSISMWVVCDNVIRGSVKGIIDLIKFLQEKIL